MRSAPRGLGVVLAAALVGLTVGAAVRSFAWYPLRVTSGSMSPTVAVGDWIVVSPRRAVAASAVARGDIVLFRFPFGGDGRAIKRVVAVAGDEVRTAGPDVVLVNGAVVSRGSAERGASSASELFADPTVHVPDGYVYILGDNVRSSVDSRSLGLRPLDDVLGTVAAVIGKLRQIDAPVDAPAKLVASAGGSSASEDGRRSPSRCASAGTRPRSRVFPDASRTPNARNMRA